MRIKKEKIKDFIKEYRYKEVDSEKLNKKEKEILSLLIESNIFLKKNKWRWEYENKKFYWVY